MTVAPPPVFLFLHTMREQAPHTQSGMPLVAAIDLDSREPVLFSAPSDKPFGITTRYVHALDTAAMMLGLDTAKNLLHNLDFEHVTETWQGVFEHVLRFLEDDATKGPIIGYAASTTLSLDVFPGANLHGSDPGFWTPQARKRRAGILHTRDAAIWTGNTSAGYAPMLRPEDWAPGFAPSPTRFATLHQAVQDAGLPAVDDSTLVRALQRLLVGTVASHATAHARLAAHHRLREDCRLIPPLWAHTQAPCPPVVPVFL